MKTKMNNGSTVFNQLPNDVLLDGIDEDRPIRRHYTPRKVLHNKHYRIVELLVC